MQNDKIKSKKIEIVKLRNFIFIAIIFSGCFGSAKKSEAAVINAASPEYADVSAAVSAASWGDTVYVPEGESDWGNNTLIIAKGINFLGAGKDKTKINSAPAAYSSSKCLISFSADKTTATSNYQFKFDGFSLKANGTFPPYSLLCLANSNYASPLTKVIISNNKFQQAKTPANSCMSILVQTAVFGVAYQNEIIDGTHAWRYLGGLTTGKLAVFWEPGSQYAMYFEDNYMHLSEAWDTSMIISGGGGNRYVSRYNTFDLSANGPNKFMQTHDIHGNQPNNPGAGIGFEAYGEHRLGGSGRWLDQRGGRVHFFMNKWSATNGSASYNIWEEFDDDAYSPNSCAGLDYPKTAGGANCLQKPRDSYYWRNFTGQEGASLVTVANILFDHYNRNADPPAVNDPLAILENQNWWRDNTAIFTGAVDSVGSCGYYKGPSCQKSGIGCGTYDQMQAITACAPGIGFWATDQGNCNDISEYTGHNHAKNIEGTLYKCGASNTWTASYAPYIYPHPLREAADFAAPSAPSGLTVR